LFPIASETWEKGKAAANPWQFLNLVDGKLLKIQK
jgi:hypothetical protein